MNHPFLRLYLTLAFLVWQMAGCSRQNLEQSDSLIIFDRSHGEYIAILDEGDGGSSRVARTMQGWGYAVTQSHIPLPQLQQAYLPAKSILVLSPFHGRNYPAAELSWLENDWIAKGGKLWVIADNPERARSFGSLNPLLEKYQLKLVPAALNHLDEKGNNAWGYLTDAKKATFWLPASIAIEAGDINLDQNRQPVREILVPQFPATNAGHCAMAASGPVLLQGDSEILFNLFHAEQSVITKNYLALLQKELAQLLAPNIQKTELSSQQARTPKGKTILVADNDLTGWNLHRNDWKGFFANLEAAGFTLEMTSHAKFPAGCDTGVVLDPLGPIDVAPCRRLLVAIDGKSSLAESIQTPAWLPLWNKATKSNWRFSQGIKKNVWNALPVTMIGTLGVWVSATDAEANVVSIPGAAALVPGLDERPLYLTDIRQLPIPSLADNWPRLRENIEVHLRQYPVAVEGKNKLTLADSDCLRDSHQVLDQCHAWRKLALDWLTRFH